MSNFTLIGKKNGMMDIIRGHMKENKSHELYEPMGKNMHNSERPDLAIPVQVTLPLNRPLDSVGVLPEAGLQDLSLVR